MEERNRLSGELKKALGEGQGVKVIKRVPKHLCSLI